MKFSLIKPIDPFHVNQDFGVNGAYYQNAGINIAGHNGLDLQATHGEPVYAAHDGICYPEVDSSGGHGVVLRTNTPFDYGAHQVYFKTIYWHLVNETPLVSTGQLVKAGDLIGHADNTGFSAGDHLHFGLKPQFNEGDANWVNVDDANGYLGAIDPTPYLQIPWVVRQFNLNLKYGDKSEEVLALQKTLKHYGFLAEDFTPILNYGTKTASAILQFRIKYGVDSSSDPLGHSVGPLTRLALNKLQ